MKIVRVLCFSALIASGHPALAQVCSGGHEGGMDATGNLCNSAVAAPLAQPASQVPAVPSGQAAPPVRRTNASVPSIHKVAAVRPGVSGATQGSRFTVR